MAENPVRGVSELRHAGKDYKFFFGWDEIIQVERAHGAGVIALTGHSEKLVSIAVAGMQRFQPGMTEEQFKALQMPLLHVQAAVQRAMKFAYNGDDRDFSKEEIKADGATKAKKKPLIRRLLQWQWPAASRRTISGA